MGSLSRFSSVSSYRDILFCLDWHRRLTGDAAMANPSLILKLERLGGRAWPARIEERLGGWTLRAADGVTRRANCVLPLGDPKVANLDTAIQRVVRFYAQQSLPPRFQMTIASQPPDLEDVLVGMGFKEELRVIVQVASIPSLDAVKHAHEAEVTATPRQDWFATYGEAEGYDQRSLAVRRDIMSRVSLPKAYAAALVEGSTVGVGFGVLDRGWLGIFAIATVERHRRRSVATAVTSALAGWALSKGVRQAYLQVSQDNEPAKRLYARLGFRDCYVYWCRTGEIPSTQRTG
jgi:ribosomal protein S18 acetylase RimI-like enzyme